MKVRVNPALCMGERLCWKVNPEVFEVDEWGFAHAKIEDVPPELESSAKIAIENCPMKAIVILEE
jgi:ferredoxin